MTTDELQYALAKQIDSLTAIDTDYGRVLLEALDGAAIGRIKTAVRREFERELCRREALRRAC